MTTPPDTDPHGMRLMREMMGCNPDNKVSRRKMQPRPKARLAVGVCQICLHPGSFHLDDTDGFALCFDSACCECFRYTP